MGRPHDPTGAAKLREVTFSYWLKTHGHHDDCEIPEGQSRPPDTVLMLEGLKLQVAFADGRARIVDESGIPIPIMEFIDTARRENRRIYGILIATRED